MIRRPARRPLVAAAALVAALSLSSCATFDNATVASVGDHELSQDDLQEMLESELGSSLLQSSVVDGRADGDAVRSIVSAWIALNALQDAGLITDADLTAVEPQLVSQFGSMFSTAPASIQLLAKQNLAASTAIQAGLIDQQQAIDSVSGVDIRVDPVYGAWDDEAFAVVALG